MSRERIILAATDLSGPADHAILQGDAWAHAMDARLLVCHVLPDSTTGLAALRAGAADDVVERVVELTGRRSDDFEVVVELGAPGAALVRAARDRGVDLLAVGAHGHAGLRQALLGTIADRVVRDAPCPVLVARHRRGQGPVLVGTDFSDPSLPAVRWAAAAARWWSARLSVLHAVDLHALGIDPYGFGGAGLFRLSPDVETQIRRRGAARLGAALAEVGADGDRLITEGPAEAALVRMAGELGAELVVVGTHGRTGLRRMVLGSVAESVVRRAPCSVLVVKLAPETVEAAA